LLICGLEVGLRLFICGFSGAGKSTLGREVATRLKTSFIDTDEALAEGEILADRIESWGWSKFRQLEAEMIMRLSGGLKGDEMVISLGGGALSEAVVHATKHKGNALAWLDTSFEECWSRIEGDSSRPLTLKGKDELARLYDERLPLYAQANIRVSGTAAVDELVSYVASFNRG